MHTTKPTTTTNNGSPKTNMLDNNQATDQESTLTRSINVSQGPTRRDQKAEEFKIESKQLTSMQLQVTDHVEKIKQNTVEVEKTIVKIAENYIVHATAIETVAQYSRDTASNYMQIAQEIKTDNPQNSQDDTKNKLALTISRNATTMIESSQELEKIALDIKNYSQTISETAQKVKEASLKINEDEVFQKVNKTGQEVNEASLKANEIIQKIKTAEKEAKNAQTQARIILGLQLLAAEFNFEI